MHRRQNNKEDELTGKIFFGKYKPEKKLGEGSFGKIYSAVNVTDGEHYALKMENKDSGQNLLENFICDSTLITKVFFDLESVVLILIESPNFPFKPFTFIFEFKYFDAASRLNNLFSTGELKSTVYFL